MNTPQKLRLHAMHSNKVKEFSRRKILKYVLSLLFGKSRCLPTILSDLVNANTVALVDVDVVLSFKEAPRERYQVSEQI